MSNIAASESCEYRLLGLPRWAVPVALCLLVLLVYANSFPGAFIFDDIHIVQNNPLVKDLDVVTIFRSDYWHGLEYSGLYRPLTILSLAVNRLLFGEGAWGYHLVNVLLHALASCLLWSVLIRWGFSLLLALLAAMLFAVHPVHTEVVNIVVGRSELLVAVGLLAAFAASRCAGRGAVALTGMGFIGALLAKESAITFVAMLPVADACIAGSVKVWRERWRLYAVLLTIALAWLWWRSYGIVTDLPRSTLTHAAAPLAYVDGLTRVLTALQHQWLYLKIQLFPVPLQSVYSTADLPPFITSPASLQGLLVIAATICLLVLIATGVRRKQPAAMFALLYMISFAVTANILIPIGVTIAERLAYFPSAWFCTGVAALALQLLGRFRGGQVAVACLCVYLLFLTVVCISRNRDYSDEPRLWTKEVQQNPRDYLGWQSVGETLTNHYRDLEAEAAYRTMLRLAPDYPGGLRSWTFFLLSRGRPAEAYESALKAQRISRSRGEDIAVAFDSMDIAEALLGVGRYEEGLAALEPVASFLDRVSRLHDLRARLLNALGRDEEAVAEFSRVTTIFPRSNLHFKFATSLLRLGHLEAAWVNLEKDLEVRGDTAEALNMLGVVAAQQEKWQEAQAAFGRAVQLEPENRYYQENLERSRLSTGPPGN